MKFYPLIYLSCWSKHEATEYKACWKTFLHHRMQRKILLTWDISKTEQSREESSAGKGYITYSN